MNISSIHHVMPLKNREVFIILLAQMRALTYLIDKRLLLNILDPFLMI